MDVPLQITFRHMEALPALEVQIRQRAEELDRFSDRITSCHVVVECRTLGTIRETCSKFAST